MHDARLCKAGFCPLTWGYFRREGRRIFVHRRGEWIDLGEFECPRHMHECNVLGCPVHTPSDSWPVRRAIEEYVDREERKRVA